MGKKRELILKRFLNENEAQSRDRRRLLREITRGFPQVAKTKPTPPLLLVSYFVDYHFGLLDSSDAQILEDLLQATARPFRLFLILDGPGGFGLAAEQIVNVCRTYGGGSFSVIVPKMAKSAATVICLGADKLILGPTAELGPIDPQIRLPDGTVTSATSYVRRYEQLLEKAETTKGNIEPFLMGLKVFDPLMVEDLEREIELSKKVAQDALFSGMWKGKKRTKELTERLKIFTDVAAKGSHGRAILYEEIRDLDINVQQITPESDLWASLWELYNRTRAALSKHCTKLIETGDASFPCMPPREVYESATKGE
ncbi:hypothetical protein FJY63_10065 [Candidatus Sumerlaeota bacterium]|nr:hypothetical protein [Candidatus Sumerlaeota bacterium]